MSLCRICAPIATVFFWRTSCGGFQLERSTAVGGAQSVENKMNGERHTGHWRCKLVPVRQRFSKAHAEPQGLCENLINTLKLLNNYCALDVGHVNDEVF